MSGRQKGGFKGKTSRSSQEQVKVTVDGNSYEERAKMRREKREAANKDRPSSPYFRTHSPTIQPSAPPYLGHISPYAHLASLSESKSGSKYLRPNPSKVVDPKRKRSISEPPKLEDALVAMEMSSNELHNGQRQHSPLPENSTTPPPVTKSSHAHHISPPHLPVQRTYESRTPKLTRGVAINNNKSAVKNVFCSDLSESDTITTVVMGTGVSGRDSESEEKSRKLSSEVGRKGVTVIPSHNDKELTESSGVVVLRDNNNGKKNGKDSKKRFSLFGSGRSDKTTTSSNATKSSSKREKRLSGGVGKLSKLSLPNLYKPTSPEFSSDASTNSPSSPTTSQSFFKKKSSSSNKDNTVSGKTGWSFKSPSLENQSNMIQARSELYLMTIGESSEMAPEMSSATGSVRAISMHDLCSEEVPFGSELDEMNPPVTIFGSTSMLDVGGASEGELTPIVGGRKGGREKEDEPILFLSNIQVNTTSPLSNGVNMFTNEKCNKQLVNATSTTNDSNVTSHDVKSHDVNSHNVSPNNNKSHDILHDKGQKSTSPEAKLESKSHDQTNKSHDQTNKSHDMSTRDSYTQLVEEGSSQDSGTLPKEFKRFTTSRKPLRKTSFGGKESPRLVPKRSPSSVSRKTLEEVPTPPSSPHASPLFNPRNKSPLTPSPVTTPKATPTSARRSLTKTKPGLPKSTPTQTSPKTNAKSVTTKATPTSKNTPLAAKTTPTSQRRASPAKIPLASPVGPRKSVERPSSGRSSFERPSSGRSSFERPSSGRSSFERPSSGRSSFERPSSGQSSFDRNSSGRSSFDRTPSGRKRVSGAESNLQSTKSSQLIHSNKSPVLDTKMGSKNTKINNGNNNKTSNEVEKTTPKSSEARKSKSSLTKPISLKETSPLSSASSTPPSTPSTPSRRRRVGVSSVTSPLIEDFGFVDFLSNKENKETSPTIKEATPTIKEATPTSKGATPISDKATPKEATPTGISLTEKSTPIDSPENNSENILENKSENNSDSEKTTTNNATKINSSLSAGGSKTVIHSSGGVQPKVTTTYVYQSRKASASSPTPPTSATPLTQTYKYVSQNRRGDKKSNENNAPKLIQAPPTSFSGNKKVTSITMPVKTVLSPTNKKPPSGTRPPSKPGTPTRTKTPTSPKKGFKSTTPSPNSSFRSKSETTSSPLLKKKAVKPSNSVDKITKDERKSEREDQESPIPTVNILNPLNSLIAVSSPPEELNAPLSPPSVLGSMFARPFSPTSPEPDDIEFQLTPLTPEVPIWSEQQQDKIKNSNEEESHLTYIYRSTLLRKTSNENTALTRTSSNKSLSPRHESKTLTRTGSPRKASLPVNTSTLTRQSKLQGSVRKGSTSTLDRASIKRKSVSRLSVGGGGTLGRPRSASVAPQHPLEESTKSLKNRASSGTSITTTTTGVDRGSIRKSTRGNSAKKLSYDRPPSIKSSKTKQTSWEGMTNTTSKDKIDGQGTSSLKKSSLIMKPKLSADLTLSVTSSAQATPIPLSKSNSSSLIINRDKETRRSIKVSSSKPPLASGGGSIRSSVKGGVSQPRLLSSDSRTSLRLSRRSSAGTISKGGGTNKSGTLKRGATSGSPSHAPLASRLSAERDDTLNIFDDISSMAQKNLLSSAAGHKIAVRPKVRQKPSNTHLQLLNQRKDVSSELATGGGGGGGGGGGEGGGHKVDPNAYSTYMGKKVLDHSALVGLAAKLDFTTVKLRKTGIVEQMMNDQESGGKSSVGRVVPADDISGNSYGVQLTTHPLMLLIVKGRKNVQTRLVQPVAASVNSGDVFVLVRENDLFLWQGKEANVIEKARGNDLIHRIYQRRELGCKCSGFIHIEEKEDLTKKQKGFWEILKGKQALNKDSAPADEIYEKGVNLATKIYQFTQEGDGPGKFVLIHDNVPNMPKISILDSKKILLFDFYSEVYIWFGKKSPPPHRKPAMIKARKHFDSQCVPPSFKPVTAAAPASPSRKPSLGAGARASGRFNNKGQRQSTRRKSTRTLERKPSKGELRPRPEWALFGRVNEGSETILFREKFSDWPEPGRIIKMKGHESSGEFIKPPPMPELTPADVSSMLKCNTKFEGLRLEGENIHRGRGNYQVSRSSFACNRVRSQTVTKYCVKEHDSVLLNEKDNCVFYSGEGYILRWGYIITVVKELEGLTPGRGMFAKDRQYQKSKFNSNSNNKTNKEEQEKRNKEQKREEGEVSSDEDVLESDEECQRVLESGGRDRCAYFFWQGHHASINEKGATAVMTVELDKEKGPQIRVVQGSEHPAFTQLFNGSMIVLLGRPENNSITSCDRGYRLYYCGGFARKEAYLLEVDTKGCPSLSFCLRSRGCYVLQHQSSSTVYVWLGQQASVELQTIAKYTGKKLKKRLSYSTVTIVQETQEPTELQSLLFKGDHKDYVPLTTPVTYTPRLFQLSSSTGCFKASEEVHISCPPSKETPDAFPFIQEKVYTADQPALFLMDAYYTIYLWMGWWPQQRNKLLQEKNTVSGTAFSRWAQDKKLALQTALNYAKECGRTPIPTVYVVTAGTEHLEFINLFPYWRDDPDVKSIVTAGGSQELLRKRTLAEEELTKYTRTSYTLEELQKKPEELNPNKLETYLSDEDFQKIFKMTKKEFEQLPSWKQFNHKKSNGLF